MIFKKVAGICRAAKGVFIDSGSSGVQFIGDGVGMYAISGLELTPERAKVCFDVPAEKEGEWIFVNNDNFVSGMEPEGEAEKLPIEIEYGGHSFVPFVFDGRCVVADARYLAPLGRVLDGMVWKTDREEKVLMGYVGMILTAVIQPVKTDAFDKMPEMLEQARRAFLDKSGGEPEDEQQNFEIDEETGEVM